MRESTIIHQPDEVVSTSRVLLPLKQAIELWNVPARNATGLVALCNLPSKEQDVGESGARVGII